MKITAVEPIHLRVPVVEAIPDGTLDVLIVKIHTDEPDWHRRGNEPILCVQSMF